MNDSADDYDEVQATNLTHNKADGQSPGEMLHEARLAQDYSIEDVCAQTRLSARTVHALEDNDFEALSQPVFARGYYRQCAKVLHVDSDRLMAAYAAWGGETAPRPASPTAVHIVPQDVGPPRWRSLGLIGGLLLLLVAIGAIFVLMPDAQLPDDSAGGNGNTVVLADSDNRITGDESGTTTGADSGNPTTTDPSSTPDAAGQDGDTSAQSAAPIQRSGGRNVNDTLGRNANADNTTAQAQPAAPQIAPNHLTINFTARSWINVRDANGSRLLSGIYEAGETRDFDGTPPYKITLGRAVAVDVTIGGQKVDIAAQTASNGTARLTVAARDN